MTDEVRKYLAYIAGMLYKVSVCNESLNDNEIQSLDNIVSELGFYNLDEKEFRW